MKGEPFVNRRYTKGVPFPVKNCTYKRFSRGGGGRYAVALSVISETACYLVSKKKGHRGILARKKTSPLVHSNLQCLTRIKNLPWGTVLEQYHNKKTFQKKITGKYYACKYIGLLLCYAKVNRCHFHRAVNFPE